MRLLTFLRSLWHQLMDMDLQPAHTAIVFHWSDGTRPDVVFMHHGIYQGEALHQRLDVLLAEHVSPCSSEDVYTEITVFWHHPNGSWDMEELVSHYCAA